MNDVQELIKAIEISHSKDWFDYTIGVTTLLVSIVAVMVGIQINKRVSLKNKMLHRQLETVFKLIESLQNQRFTIVVREKEDWAGLICETSFFRIQNISENNETLYKALSLKEPFYFTEDGYNSLEFVEFANNPFTPNSISKVLNEFKWQGQKDWLNKIIEENDRKVKTYMTESRRNNNSKMEKPITWYIKGKRVHKDLASFVELTIELDMAIRKWLKKYKVDDLNY